MNFSHTFGKGLRPLPRTLIAGSFALTLGACSLDDILEVRDPEQVTPTQVENAESVPFLVNGAIRTFYGAYSGLGDDSFLTSTGTLTDEMYNGDTFTTRIAADQRSLQAPVTGNVSDPGYSRLQQTRVAARRAAAAAAQYTPEDVATFARMRAIEGYAYVTLGEGWCGAVPFGSVPETGPLDPTTVIPGAPIGTTAIFDSAIVRFREGVTASGGDNLARIGLARALMNRSNTNLAAAAAAVASVPTTFVYRIEHSSNEGTQYNPVYALQSNGRYGVSNDEGGLNPTGTAARPDELSTEASYTIDDGEGIPFRALNDPRVPYSRTAAGAFTASFRQFNDLHYPSYAADVPVASGVEARLIEAEALLASGDITGYMGKLNDLRAAVATLLPVLYPEQSGTAATLFPRTLAPLTDPGTAAGRVEMLFRERALWMYNTGHRQGDLRRMVRNYGYTSQQVFPSGPFYRGGSYGNDVAFPVPFAEQNNALYTPASCVTTQA